MYIYEFITPSDQITFKAENNKIAFLVCLLIGEGKAGCERWDGEKINTMTAFIFDQEARNNVYKEYCGTCDVQSVFDENIKQVSDALLSFSYGSVSDREQYDDALAAITDECKLKEFKAKHEDRCRTSISKWVAHAWTLGEQLIKTNEI